MSPRRTVRAPVAVAVVAAREAVAVARSAALAVLPPGPLPRAAPVGGRPPAVLVHGYLGNAHQLRPLAASLLRHGTPACAFVEYPSLVATIPAIVDTIGAVAEPLARVHGPVDVIGHSLGALCARLWIKRYGGAASVRRFVSLGGPHGGTALYRLVPSPVRGAMRPDGPWAQALNDGDEPVPTTVVRARWDHQVLPPARAAIAGAHEETIVEAWGHNALLWSPEAHAAVVRALAP